MRARITYETVTHESAKNGEAADHGFYSPGGWHDSIVGEAGKGTLHDARNGAYDLSLGDAVREARDLGCCEINYVQGSRGLSVRSVDPVHDRAFFEDGESKTYTVHFDNVSPGTAARIRALFS